MRWMSWMVMSVAAIAVMTGCASSQTETSSEESISDLSEQSIEVPLDDAVASGDGELPPPTPVPYLTPPTSPDQRAGQVQPGRPDPFAPLPTSPVVVPARVNAPAAPRPLAQQPAATVPATTQLSPVPFAAAPLPVQPPRPASAPPAPPVAAAPVPAPAPTVSLIESIEVSGVVRVGEQTSAIVRVPTERSSRTARVGDRIANGQVLLKRIDLAGGGDPVVVLEQNGVEVFRSVSLMGG